MKFSHDNRVGVAVTDGVVVLLGEVLSYPQKAAAVGAALRHTTFLPTDSVRATVHDHTVTLVGAVGWHHQRTAAAHAVSVLPGVVGVRNLIELRPGEAMLAGPAAWSTTGVTHVDNQLLIGA